jgi:hypothetical protein
VTKKNRTEEQDLDTLMSFLAESVAQMSDDQLKEEFAGDPVPRTKEVLKAAVKDCKMERLRSARAQYDVASKELTTRTYNIPKNISEQRALLASIFGRKPELSAMAITAQHRDLKDLTDSDVESFLKQLVELGLLNTFLE